MQGLGENSIIVVARRNQFGGSPFFMHIRISYVCVDVRVFVFVRENGDVLICPIMEFCSSGVYSRNSGRETPLCIVDLGRGGEKRNP